VKEPFGTDDEPLAKGRPESRQIRQVPDREIPAMGNRESIRVEPYQSKPPFLIVESAGKTAFWPTPEYVQSRRHVARYIWIPCAAIFLTITAVGWWYWSMHEFQLFFLPPFLLMCGFFGLILLFLAVRGYRWSRTPEAFDGTPLIVEASGRVRYGDRELTAPKAVRRVLVWKQWGESGPEYGVALEYALAEESVRLYKVKLNQPWIGTFGDQATAGWLASQLAQLLGVEVDLEA
jgi:hypothetical protein